MIDNPDKVQVLYFPFPHDDLQTEGLIVSPRDIDLRPRVGLVLPYAMYGTQAKVLRSDANGNLGVNIQGAIGALPSLIQDALGHTVGPLVAEVGGGYAAPFSMSAPSIVNLIAPRTDTATTTITGIVIPPAYEYVLMLNVTAASGTSPTLTLSIRQTTTQATLFTTVNMTQATGIAQQVTSVGPGVGGQMLSPTIAVLAGIGGTTPSFTWYLDMLYR